MTDARYNRATEEPGGMECEECGVIFIGADYHRICAVCAGINPPPPDKSPLTIIMCGPADPPCEHDFKGWRPFEDGHGGETVCTKCGMGAMAWSLRTGL